MERYLQALLTEIEAVGAKFRQSRDCAESLYVGGGTPTSLSVFALERLLSCAVESFDLSEVREFCVEAGRPDTITGEKLSVMRHYGVDRVSVNPQSMTT